MVVPTVDSMAVKMVEWRDNQRVDSKAEWKAAWKVGLMVGKMAELMGYQTAVLTAALTAVLSDDWKAAKMVVLMVAPRVVQMAGLMVQMLELKTVDGKVVSTVDEMAAWRVERMDIQRVSSRAE